MPLASPDDDLALFRRLANGPDGKAIAVLFDRYSRRFLATLQRRGFSQSDAEDVVHDCFLRLLSAGAALGRVAHPRAYIWRMLLNSASDSVAAMRLLRDAEPYNPDSEASSMHGESPHMNIDADSTLDIDKCLGAAWRMLVERAPDRAQALEWVAVDGLSGREISELLGRSYGATREYLSQCRHVLRELVRQACPDWEGDHYDIR